MRRLALAQPADPGKHVLHRCDRAATAREGPAGAAGVGEGVDLDVDRVGAVRGGFPVVGLGWLFFASTPVVPT
jgi:hypothetical protein